jgi:ABC-type nitrate/sulfonate/bicarbonate transport system substrate-binding protein
MAAPRRFAFILATVLATLAAFAWPGGAQAQDKLKVVIGQINNWENQVPQLGVQAGIFKKHGLELRDPGDPGRRRDAVADHLRQR